jgi:23S rRNA C2498 (ribose-2'-O)-methylase RlmM
MPFARFRYPAAGCLPTRSSTRHGEPITKVIPLAEGEKDQRMRAIAKRSVGSPGGWTR